MYIVYERFKYSKVRIINVSRESSCSLFFYNNYKIVCNESNKLTYFRSYWYGDRINILKHRHVAITRPPKMM